MFLFLSYFAVILWKTSQVSCCKGLAPQEGGKVDGSVFPKCESNFEVGKFFAALLAAVG